MSCIENQSLAGYMFAIFATIAFAFDLTIWQSALVQITTPTWLQPADRLVEKG